MQWRIPQPTEPIATGAPRRALLLAYRYPATGGGSSAIAARRSEALMKHLPSFGWEGVLVTAQADGLPPGAVQVPDHSWAARLERAGRDDPSRGATAPGGSAQGMNPAQSTNSAQATAPALQTSPVQRIRRAAIDAAKGVLRWFPPWHDRYSAFSRAVVTPAVAAGCEANVDLVWATLSPLSLGPAAVSIARRLGVPCVLDLRDPPEEGLGNGPRFWLRRALEQADALSVAAPSCLSELVTTARSGRRPALLVLSGNWHTELIAPERSERFTILHAGSWHPNYNLDPLLGAVEQLAAELPGFRDHARAVFIGRGSGYVEAVVRGTALAPLIDCQPLAPYAEVAALQRSAGVLLIARGSDGYKAQAITGKIFDYAAHSAPLLSIGGADDLHAQLVAWLGGCWTTDSARITEFIREAYLRWRESGVSQAQRNPAALEYLTQPRMAAEFAALFDATVAGGQPALRQRPPWEDA